MALGDECALVGYSVRCFVSTPRHGSKMTKKRIPLIFGQLKISCLPVENSVEKSVEKYFYEDFANATLKNINI